MKYIKKAFKIFKENFLVLFWIEKTFLLLASILIFFSVKRIISYFVIVKSLMPELKGLRDNLASNVDLVQFNNIMALVGEGIKNIIIGIILTIVGFFLLWCIFQSTSWRLCYKSIKEKISLKKFFKNFSWKYLFKFSLVSLFFLILISPLLFQIIINLRGFILNDIISRFGLAENISGTGSIGIVVLSAVILLFLIYFLNLIYIFLNENTIFKAVKKAFLIGIKKFYLFFIVLLCLTVSFSLLFLIRINIFFVLLSVGLIFLFYIYFKVLINVIVRE